LLLQLESKAAAAVPKVAVKATVTLRLLTFGAFSRSSGVPDMASPRNGLTWQSCDKRQFYPIKVNAMKEQGNLSRHDAAAAAIYNARHGQTQ
jgi:hypothetical protein